MRRILFWVDCAIVIIFFYYMSADQAFSKAVHWWDNPIPAIERHMEQEELRLRPQPKPRRYYKRDKRYYDQPIQEPLLDGIWAIN